jgi:hypothetical protein
MRQKGQECRRCASPRAGLFPAVRRRGHILTASPSRPPMISGNPSQQRNTRDAPGIRTRLRRLCRPPPTTSETCVTSGPRRSRTCAATFGGWRPIHWTIGAWCAGMDSNHRVGCRVYSPVRSPLRHRRVGCLTGFEPVNPRVTAESLSHLGQGTSRSGRTRTCARRCVEPLLCR